MLCGVFCDEEQQGQQQQQEELGILGVGYQQTNKFTIVLAADESMTCIVEDTTFCFLQCFFKDQNEPCQGAIHVAFVPAFVNVYFAFLAIQRIWPVKKTTFWRLPLMFILSYSANLGCQKNSFLSGGDTRGLCAKTNFHPN